MYALRPIVTLTDVCPHVETMYKIRNIHEDEAIQEGVRCHHNTETPCVTKMPDVTKQSPLPEFSALETRQEKILCQLAELKKQVFTLSNFLKRSSLEAGKTQNKSCEEKIEDHVPLNPVNLSLVINADPCRPPYSILALQKLWKDVNIRVNSYTHSSISNIVSVIFDSNVCSNSNNIINVSLIYKKVNDLEVITSVHNNHIIGEVNLLRYLSRLIGTHNYEKNNNVECVQATDNILDLCYSVHYQSSPDKTNQALSTLYNALKRMLWSSKDEPNIADIAAWSTIKQISKIKVPQMLREWYEWCEQTFID